MEARKSVQLAPPAANAGMDHSEEMLAELDEPPDELKWSPTKLHFGYFKTHPSMQRRESLLTRQLHSETEHTDDEHSTAGRTTSIQSMWSAHSATSMTDLTSDDGRSMPSPAISPPLSPKQQSTTLPQLVKPLLEQSVKIAGQNDATVPTSKDVIQEKTVEANLGRKRCISFACRGKQESKPTPPPTSTPAPAEPTSPPKRKCMLKFACPTRTWAENKAEKPVAKRPASPPPRPDVRRSTSKTKHRGSDSTVTHVSPKSVRRSPPSTTPIDEQAIAVQPRRYPVVSEDGNSSNEATRFHEFASSDDEPEEWVQESTCHRNRLTVEDTLKKENLIRKTCVEAAEEVLEEEDEDDLEDDLAAVADLTDENVDEVEDESDEGFHSDDEGGFASSDSEREDDSDYEWWRPGGASTAATSVEHLDRLAIVNSKHVEPGSSANTGSSTHLSPRSSTVNLRKPNSSGQQTQAIDIDRRGSIDLPDSCDFVCGTLDEDRPIEQAYIHRKKAKDAAKRPIRPQDIDPTFPTSDPEMDEEDDDDVDEVEASDSEEDPDMVHGAMEELHTMHPTPLRAHGRRGSHRSPPPTGNRLHHSPPPKRTMARSPAPVKRARSPAPAKLFGQSPRRGKSPAPGKRMTSPPNSPVERNAQPSRAPHGFASRPQLTHTASLPRRGPIPHGKLAHWESDDEEHGSDDGPATLIPKRGAIDIVKGVEFKRELRKKKLYQKMCAKNAAKGEKPHKVKPGKGAERMREVGLQLQQYHGKAAHILSL